MYLSSVSKSGGLDTGRREPALAILIRALLSGTLVRERCGEIMTSNFQYTVETTKTFEHAVQAVEQKSTEHGFRVLHTHDFAAALAEKGFPREPVKVVEICNARYASEVLKRDISIALMLPCPISIYVQSGKTYISTMLPTILEQYYPQAGIHEIATAVQATVLRIINEAK